MPQFQPDEFMQKEGEEELEEDKQPVLSFNIEVEERVEVMKTVREVNAFLKEN